jgi:hypothetical protein
MRGHARGPRVRVLIALALALCLPVSVDADASDVGCSRSITSGSMMGPAIVRSSIQQVQLARGGSPIACGGTLTPSESGLTLAKSSTGTQYCKAPSVCPRTHGDADGGTLTHDEPLRSN